MIYDRLSKKVVHRASLYSQEVAEQLEEKPRLLVVAESCTAGLICALLAQNPGISRFLCGSAVSYRDATKENWLGIEPRLIQKHSAVSQAVTEAMAFSVLAKTSEASIGLAITGHLEEGLCESGPVAHVALVTQSSKQTEPLLRMSQDRSLFESSRVGRQWESACFGLECLRDELKIERDHYEYA